MIASKEGRTPTSTPTPFSMINDSLNSKVLEVPHPVKVKKTLPNLALETHKMH
jgi:hypothetical protein